jgi:UDP-N-acetylmuramoyl-tripeptide--D-alanyl-D-alanine ligase
LVSEGSLNNHLGVPLSLARLPREAGYGVFEMGMNHPGEIGPLSRMARPHVALVTTVEPVHTEFFESLDEIADAKAEVFEGLAPGGVAVLNRDNPYFERLSAAARAFGAERIVGFGRTEEAEVRILEERPEPDGTTVRARVFGAEVTYRIGVPGRHWVTNSAAVLATTVAAGGDLELAAETLTRLEAPQGRGKSRRIQLADEGGFEVIDESYNASPVSMRAAIDVLAGRQPSSSGRRIAVLGDMLELGEAAAERHAELALPLQEAGIDLVYVAGPLMVHLWDALAPDIRGRHAADSSLLAPQLAAEIRHGDVVMVKGSAGSRMRVVVEALLALDAEEMQTARQRAVNGN